MKHFLFLFLALVLLSNVIAQDACNLPCTYEDNPCEVDSECSVCLDVNGYPVGPNGAEGTCQQFYNTPEFSDMAVYIMFTVGALFAVHFVRKKLKNNKNI